MTNNPGILIALEGLQETGKYDQVALLRERLENAGYNVVVYDFPRTQQEAGYFSSQYQNGSYGASQGISPYTASLFYALDRYDAMHEMTKALAAGNIIIAHRYVGSNMAYQGAKFENAEERRGYYVWLDNLEHQVLGVPRAHASFVLYDPDHYTESTYEQRVIASYDELSQLFPNDFTRVDCRRAELALSPDQLHELVWRRIEAILPPAPKTAKPKQKKVEAEPVSESNDSLAADYNAYLQECLKTYNTIFAEYTDHLTQQGVKTTEAREIAKQQALLVLPLGVLRDVTAENLANIGATTDLQYIAGKIEQARTTTVLAAGPTIKVMRATPRNELQLVPDIISAGSKKRAGDAFADVSSWPIAQKIEYIEGYISELNRNARVTLQPLKKVTYDITLQCNPIHMLELGPLCHEIITDTLPREVDLVCPEALQAAALDAVHESHVAQTQSLYARLLAENRYELAAKVLPIGATISAQLLCTARQLKEISHETLLTSKLRQQLAEVHPTLSTVLLRVPT